MNKAVIGLVLATASLGAQAAELSKSYLEIGYGETSLEGTPSSVDPQGFIIAGSYEFANGIFMGLKIDQHSDSLNVLDDLFDDDYDVDETTFNLGYILRTTDNGRLAVGAQVGEFEVSTKNANSTIDTRRIYGEYEHAFSQRISAYGQAGYELLDNSRDDDDGIFINIGLRFDFTQRSAVVLEYTNGVEYTQTEVKYRYSF
ncbi:outer membrane beta-barrel protein [Pseudoalteromonas viridis]|uniref:Outer membrane beta-barrel protein n=1 Tax=Pseudoalteromonas viridis TaxID=339617 RepID=A0ABX7V118_9GAMM|nr:outer membrane beta-barrel protein [Pseudoalteromonas viridis]QTL34150.1 outer membrane beta-barrel protein [Pseudoalteromonas viridis]